MKEKDLITAEIYEANASHSEMDILTKLETRLQHLVRVFVGYNFYYECHKKKKVVQNY